MDGRTDGQNILCFLQDIVSLGLLPKEEGWKIGGGKTKVGNGVQINDGK